MPKKKPGRKPKSSRKPSQSRRPKAEREPLSSADLPDWRTIEGVMRGLWGMSDQGGAETPLDRAQDLIYSALEREGEQRVAAAREALAISPDCADAYVLLAEEAKTVDEAIDLYRQGVAAGERALGKKAFRQYRGHFWGVLETRPYMRARLGLARALWDAGRREEAVDHYQDLLRLNPNDNQGTRYLLANALLELNRHDELQRLLEQYEEDGTAAWAYSWALLAYREEGDRPQARELLQEAKEVNPYVPEYLTGRKPLPPELPPYFSYGGEDEAAYYVTDSLVAWRQTPGAIAWVRKVFGLPFGPEREVRRPSWKQLQARLVHLPLAEGEVWQIDARPISRPFPTEQGGTARPWIVVLTSVTEDAILQLDFGESRPSASEVWDYLTQSMLRPRQGEPRRPAVVEVRLKTFVNSWRAKLEQIGVACVQRDSLDHIDEILARFPSQARQETPAAEGELATLPQQAGEVWQVDMQRMPVWLEEEGEPVRPWAALVVNRDEDLVLAHELTAEAPTAERLWECVAHAIQQPAAGEPHRPGVIEVRPEFAEALRARLEPVGIRGVAAEKLDLMERVLKSLAEHLSGGEVTPGLLDVPGMNAEQVGSFFKAAAAFYRRAPWRQIQWDTVIKIECDRFQSGPWYALVMGQSGMVLGIALYEDFGIIREMLSGGTTSEDAFRRTSAISVLFGEAFEMPFADLDAAETHGWPIAAPEAYPHAQRVNPGYTARPLLPWELQLLEGVLRAMPDFIAEHRAEQTTTVPTAAGSLTLRLSRLELD